LQTRKNWAMWNGPVRSGEWVSPAVLRLPSMESSSVPSRARRAVVGPREERPAARPVLRCRRERARNRVGTGLYSASERGNVCGASSSEVTWRWGFQAQTVGSQDVVSYQHDGSCRRMMSSPSKKAIVQVDRSILKQSIVTSRQLIYPLTTTWRATARSRMLQVASHSTRLTAAEK
jgi:hypothetical protein